MHVTPCCFALTSHQRVVQLCSCVAICYNQFGNTSTWFFCQMSCHTSRSWYTIAPLDVQDQSTKHCFGCCSSVGSACYSAKYLGHSDFSVYNHANRMHGYEEVHAAGLQSGKHLLQMLMPQCWCGCIPRAYWQTKLSSQYSDDTAFATACCTCMHAPFNIDVLLSLSTPACLCCISGCIEIDACKWPKHMQYLTGKAGTVHFLPASMC